jgi:hypothetical protein
MKRQRRHHTASNLGSTQPSKQTSFTLNRTELAVLGVVLIVVGLVFFVFRPLSANRTTYVVERVQHMQPLTANEVQATAPGEDVLVEGRIWQGTQPHFRSFVVYVHEIYRAKRGWSEQDSETPALVVATPDGLVQVTNTNYYLLRRRLPVEWRPAFHPFSQSEQYRGLAAGSSVVIFGRVVKRNNGNGIAAEYVAGGTHGLLSEAIKRERSTDDYNMSVGFGLVLVAGWILLIAGLQALVAARRSRVVQPDKTQAL